MMVQTTTWRANAGWASAIPEPDGRVSLVVVLADDVVALPGGADPLGDITDLWQGQPIVGCSTAGQFVGPNLLEPGVTVTVLRFDDTDVRAVHVDVAAAGSARRSGRQLAHALAAPELQSIMVLADGLAVNGSALADGVADVLPDVDLWGALAADGERFSQTWTLVDGRPRGGHVSGIGFYGDAIEVGHGHGDGWHGIGPERWITRSFGNVVERIDDQPPLPLYEEYLGELAAGLPATASYLPMTIRDLDDRRSVRSVIHVDDHGGTITMAGDVAQGATAQFAHATVEALVHSAELAGKEASLGERPGPGPDVGHREVAFAFSGSGRRMALGERVDEELEAVASALGPHVPLVGCWTYGEIATDDGRHDVHNQSMTITTLRERTHGTATHR